MMILLLAVISFVIILYINKKDWISPSVLYTLSFIVSGIIFSLNAIIWSYELNNTTITTLFLGSILFTFGSLLGGSYSMSSRQKSGIIINYTFKRSSLIFLAYFSFLFLILRVLDIIMIIGSLNLLDLATYRQNETITIFGSIIKMTGPFFKALCMIMMIVVVSNKLNKVPVKKMCYYPILTYAASCAISSSRIDILQLVLYFLIIFMILYKERNNNKSLSFKQIKYVTISLLFLVASFWGLGFLTGKSQKQESVVDNFSIYAGSSIALLDNYMNGFNYNPDNLGTETFIGLTNIFSWIGIDKKYVESRHSEYSELGTMSHSSNVYTCYKALLHDYNYVGMYIIVFLEGLVFQIFYRRTRQRVNKREGAVWLAFYSLIGCYLLFSSIDERIFSSFLTLTTLVFFLSLKVLQGQLIVNFKKV